MSQQKSDLEFLTLHSKTLFARGEQILSDQKLFAAYSPEVYLKIAYTTGGGLLPLGVLIELWLQNHWTHECEKCQGKVLIHRLGGSPLSGSNVWRGMCIDCGEVVEEGTWKGTEKHFINDGVVPAVRARKKWNVSEDFGFEKLQRRKPSLKRIDVQGGMTIETDDGPADLQLKVDHTKAPERNVEAQPSLQASITFSGVLKWLREQEVR